jgi:hypothetical protein
MPVFRGSSQAMLKKGLKSKKNITDWVVFSTMDNVDRDLEDFDVYMKILAEKFSGFRWRRRFHGSTMRHIVSS